MPSTDPPRSLTTTLAPRAASSSAWQRPRPPPAPVTMATLPSKRMVMAKAPSENLVRICWRALMAEGAGTVKPPALPRPRGPAASRFAGRSTTRYSSQPHTVQTITSAIGSAICTQCAPGPRRDRAAVRRSAAHQPGRLAHIDGIGPFAEPAHRRAAEGPGDQPAVEGHGQHHQHHRRHHPEIGGVVRPAGVVHRIEEQRRTPAPAPP